jgi:hypothetical protein
MICQLVLRGLPRVGLWGYTGGLIVLSGFIIVVYIGLQRRLVGIDVGEKAFPSSEV